MATERTLPMRAPTQARQFSDGLNEGFQDTATSRRRKFPEPRCWEPITFVASGAKAESMLEAITSGDVPDGVIETPTY